MRAGTSDFRHEAKAKNCLGFFDTRQAATLAATLEAGV
jgi:hypothetical protein